MAMEDNRILGILENLDQDTKAKLTKSFSEINDETEDLNPGIGKDIHLSAEDARLAKIIAAAMKIAEEKDPNYTARTESEYDLAAEADQSADHINLAEKVFSGEMTPEEAGTYLIDKAQSRFITFLEDTINAGVPKVADKITKILTKYCPEAEEYGPIIKDSITALQPGLKALANVAVNIGAKKLKEYLPKVIKTVKETVLN